jgi:hypothetical protein
VSHFPTTIISGGQTGADRAGLDFALKNGLSIGGFCPKGRRAKDGRISDIYPLIETVSSNYPERTRRNIELADVTIIFNAGDSDSRGTALTAKTAEQKKRPFVILRGFPNRDIDVVALTEFLIHHNPDTLNVAGNSEDKTPGMYAHVMAVLSLVASTFLFIP